MNLYDPNEIRALLDAHGFAFAKTMGQNFLVDESVPSRIAETVDGSMGVLEIGPGHGALTVKLCARAAKVVSVELDKRLIPVLRVTLYGHENSEVVQADALKLDLKALCEEKLAGLTPVVCANLPYNITTAAVTAFVKAGCFRQMTLMVQKEAADRLLSRVGTDGWGPLPMALDADYTAERYLDVPPESFVPRPHVDSQVVVFKRRESSAVPGELRPKWDTLVKAAFLQRRKTLANGLESAGYGKKAELGAVLEELGYDARIRGEKLGAEDFVRIAQRL